MRRPLILIVILFVVGFQSWGQNFQIRKFKVNAAGGVVSGSGFRSIIVQSDPGSEILQSASFVTHTGLSFGTSSSASELIAHWPLSGELGGADLTGLTDGLVFTDTGIEIDRFKNLDESIVFNGTSTFLTSDDVKLHPQGDNYDFTYSFWEYHTTDVLQQATLLDLGNDESEVILETNTQIRYSSSASSPEFVGADVGVSSADLNRWNHIVVVGDGPNIRIYVNGILAADQSYFRSSTAKDIYFGNKQDLTNPFNGRIDDIRIYNYGLPETDVLDLFNERIDTSTPISWLEPSLATPEDEVTLFYNAERGNKGLMGADRVYIHLGAVVGDDPVYLWGDYVLDTTWFSGTKDNGIGEMTNTSGNTWQYTLSPSSREALGVPPDTLMQRVGMIFRSPDAFTIGKGTPSEYGDFPGGRVEDGTYWTAGDIYLNLLNPTGEELDSVALVAIYNALGGEDWTDNSGWLTGPLDTWYGVTVSGGRVIDVFLDNNNLSGTLPDAIGRLDACQGFSVTGNSISGSIPTAIGDMTAMQWLYLDSNLLTGEIPASIGNLSNLNGLYLNNNQLSGIIPGEIGNLTGLTDLSLYTNQLIGSIPTSFQDLTGLQYLDLEDNNLNGLVPAFLGSMTNLVELWLAGNSFSGSIPTELGNLFNLDGLYLGNNEFTGSIPVELASLSNLTTLALNDNNLTGEIPTELGNLFNLDELYLEGNILTGAVPSSFGGLSFLTIFNLEDNLLDEMVSLSSIDELYIANNKFTMEDILMNLGTPSVYDYDPQELAGEPQNRFVANGSDYTFDLGFDKDVVGSTYTWYQDGVVFVANSSPSIFIPAIHSGYTGTWTVEITNSSLPGLILTTEDIFIEVLDICASEATDPANTRIDRFVFANIDNSSETETCATYTNYTNLSATVYPGQSIDFGFQIGTCGEQNTAAMAFFIDIDQDGSFSSFEKFGESPAVNSSDFFSVSTQIDPVAQIGTYLMRVVVTETNDPGSITGCGTYPNGETEDYTLNIVDGTSDLILEIADVTPNAIFSTKVGINAGNEISVTSNLGNAGLAEVTDLVRGIGYYLSTDQTLSDEDAEIGVSGITSLPGGEIITLTDEVVTIPGSTLPGEYYLIAEADPDGALNDPDRSDNFDVTSIPITVTVPPDAEDPVVTLQSPPSSYTLGSGGVTLTANITDNFGIASVVFGWARMSEITDDFDADQYTAIIPEEQSAGIYTHTLNDSDFDAIGIQYFYGATDVYGNIGNSTPFPAKVSVEFAEGSLTVRSVSGVSNSNDPQETDYRIFSVPVRGATINSILGFTSTDKSQWRVWQYNNNSNQELTSTSSSLAPGKGFWLIYQNASGIDLNFGGVSVDASNSNPFIMNLSSGINLIGNPYNFPISWQQVLDYNASQGNIPPVNENPVTGLTFYQGNFDDRGNSNLGVTEGAFVTSNENYSLEIPFSAQTTRLATNARTYRNSLDNDTWEVGFKLSTETTFYNVASVGMNPGAEEGRDWHDEPAMPYLFRYLEFNSSNELLAERISKDFVNTREDHVWEFEAVTTFDPSGAELSWDNSYFGDNDRQLYLYDEQEERIINMREQTSYHFYLNGKQSFRIMYGSPEFIESSLKPDRFTLGHAYPNPFADLTRIPFSLSDDHEMYKVRLEVYNSIGELVKVLADDTYGSGFYAADWDGTNVHGQQVSEGIYIYKLSIAHEDGSDDLTGKLVYGRE